jgi:ferredoxin-NADP reductase/cytochrome P450/CRP-like cAMP-binding protein
MDEIRRALRSSRLFGELDAARFERLMMGVTRVALVPGEVLFREGDFADAVYVLLDGDVQVFKERADGSLLILRKLRAGSHFGEQSLLPGRSGLRTAGVRAHTAAVLARVDKTDFQQALAANDPLKAELVQIGEEQFRSDLARQSALFQHLGVDLGDGARERTFDDGEVVFREGEEANCLYGILSGRAAVYQEHSGQPVLLNRLEAGQCLGELALLRRTVRSATVVADGPLRVYEVSAARFRELFDRSPELREYMQTLERIYLVPRRGFLTQSTGRFAGLDSIVTRYQLTDGRVLVAARVVGLQLYHLERLAAPGEPAGASTSARYQDPAHDVERELRLAPDGAIVGILARGYWADLDELHLRALDGLPLSAEEVDRFTRTGSVLERPSAPGRGDDDLLCTCVHVSRGAIRRAIAAGCRQLEALQGQLRCGTVCGSCVPRVREMLGQAEWTRVTVSESLPVAHGIRSFRLAPMEGGVAPWLPGQHVVLQAEIDGSWVERPYTLSSTPRRDYYELTVKREPRGVFSRWLFEACPPGTPLRVSPPQGTCHWEPGECDVVCLVAGIGVTPALAICRAALEEGTGRRVHVDYSARSPAEFAYADELREAASANPHVEVTLRDTRRQGRIRREDVAVLVRQHPAATFFLCGPTRYLEDVAGFLAEAGVPARRVRIEVFVHSGDAPVAPGEPTDTLTATPSRETSDYLFPEPELPPPARLEWLKRGLGRLADLINADALDWRVRGVQLNPFRALWAALESRLAGTDPRLPTDYLAVLAIVGKGTRRHQMEAFERIGPRFGANKRRALEARRGGTPLPPHTPDGETWTYAIPNLPLVQYTGEHAVDTGWTRAAPGPLIPVFMTRSRAAIHSALIDAQSFDRGPLPYHYVQQMLGSPSIHPSPGCKAAGLFAGQLHDNSTWTRDRALGVKMFGPEALDALGVGMGEALRGIGDELEAGIARTPDRVVDMNVLLSRIAYRMVVRAAFGNLAEADFDALGHTLAAPVRGMLDYVTLKFYGQPGNEAEFVRNLSATKRVIVQMTDFVREAHAAGRLSPEQLASPLIRLILFGDESGPLDADRLFPFVLGIVFGGHETTGHSLAWTFYHLARDPQLAATIRGEIDGFHAAHDGRPISIREYDERPLTVALFYEVWRRHSPMAAIARTTLAPGEVPPDPDTGIGGFRYPKDALVLCAILGAHMDPETYPDPAAFRIDRFLQGVTPEMSLIEQGRQVRENIRRLEEDFRLLTFSLGRGSCLGRGFNMLESFIVLDELWRRFSFELAYPGVAVVDAEAIVSGPEPGKLVMRIRPRPDSDSNGAGHQPLSGRDRGAVASAVADPGSRAAPPAGRTAGRAGGCPLGPPSRAAGDH